MFIRATTTTIEEHEVDVTDLATFKSRFPRAQIQTIDGRKVDSQCEKGHFYHSQGYNYRLTTDHWTKCRTCYDLAMCNNCDRRMQFCTCHRCDDYDD